MKKDVRYTFRTVESVRDNFMAYCKIAKISPSDVLTECMQEFNCSVESIIKMENVEELKELMQDKFSKAEKEIELLKANKK